jgi:hypothetical protein
MGITLGWPPCWHGSHNVNAKLGLTPGKASHHLAQKFVELGVGFLKGQRCCDRSHGGRTRSLIVAPGLGKLIFALRV